MSEKKERLVTPIGFAKWAYLNKPKQFMENGKPKGNPKYEIEVHFDPANPEWKAWAGELQKMFAAVPAQFNSAKEPISKQPLFKKELDEVTDQPTGRWFVTFKTGEKFKPGIFDRHGENLPDSVMVGNESRVRVNYSPNSYTAFGGGINLYLNAVQVLDLIEHQSKSAKSFGFEVEPVSAGKAGGPPQAEDDLPF
jgi:hypothetical protein